MSAAAVQLRVDVSRETEAALEGVRALLALVEDDPERPGIEDTPGRVVRAMLEVTRGYHMSPADILGRTFEAPAGDHLVVVRDIAFSSTCEHHLMPFTGVATVAYRPGSRVIGLSKIPRLVECYALRLQLQERLTQQVAMALMDHGGALGALVVVAGRHACMSCRGVRQVDADMVTVFTAGEMDRELTFSLMGVTPRK